LGLQVDTFYSCDALRTALTVWRRHPRSAVGFHARQLQHDGNDEVWDASYPAPYASETCTRFGPVAVAVAVLLLWLWLWLCCYCAVAVLWLWLCCGCAVTVLAPATMGSPVRCGPVAVAVAVLLLCCGCAVTVTVAVAVL